MARRIDWNYTPKRSKWVDPRQKTRRAPSVKDDIRRQNGGFLASEISSGSAPYMTYDKRFPGTQNWLKETFGKDAQKRLDESIKDLGPGTTATITKKGTTGVKISREVSPQAVAPGSSRPGNPWDVIRAGIHNQATKWAIGQAGRDNLAFGQGVDLAKDELAGQFVDNLTKSIQDDIDKNWKPAAPTAVQKAESTAREKVGTGTTTEERKGNLETWNAARQEAHAEEAKRHEDSMKYLDDTEKWMKDFAKQHGLKDPTQSAAKGGSAHSLPVSRSEDRFLDDLIGEMEV